MPRDSPLIITVAAPVSLDEARFLVGRYESDVKYSVIAPIRTPATSRTVLPHKSHMARKQDSDNHECPHGHQNGADIRSQPQCF